MEFNQLRDWIGRSETRNDEVTLAPAVAMAATLDLVDMPIARGAALPPLWHWLYFTPQAPQRDIGPDGHAKRGGFLPPVPLPRRMFAGGRFEFHQPLRVGDPLTRVSTIKDVNVKNGRSGTLVFVTVRHDISSAAGLVMSEEHDIVYRDNPTPGALAISVKQASSDASFSREIIPDPVLLFRYSALTFNSHRIHYDRSYVTEVEGYLGLIVHGPLIATLLVELFRANMPERMVTGFSFRAVSPLFDNHRFTVCGRENGARNVALWARNHAGELAMEATIVTA